MSSSHLRAPVLESGFAKSYQVLPSASVMSQEFDDLCNRLRLEQSLTSEQPSFSQLLEVRPGSMTSSEALRNIYADSSVVRLKRTARALAAQAQSLDDDDEHNFVTSDKLPSIAAPLILSVGVSQTKLQAMPAMTMPSAEPAPASLQSRRRNLLPAPKTNMMPASSPTELRALVHDIHSKRQEQLTHRKTRQGLQMASKTRANQQAKSTTVRLWKSIKSLYSSSMQAISNILDQLALA